MKTGEMTERIVEDLQKYTEKKSADIDKAVRTRTKQARDDIIANSPVRKRVPKSGVVKVRGIAKANYQPGAYKGGWVEHISTAREYRTQGYVRNKTNHQIVHLLEKGHRSRNGGLVPPSPEGGHVLPAEAKAREGLANDIDRILKE